MIENEGRVRLKQWIGIMRFRGLYPSGAFLLLILGTVLFLLSREPGNFGGGTHKAATGDWVCLTDPEVGSSYHSFQAGQVLGPLVAKELPRRSVPLADRCRRIPLEGGTEILLGRVAGSDERDCVVSPLPERCRYLLGMPLNVNRAGEEELELLPGIGPRLARRIVEVRESTGRFSSPEDFLRVPGIGGKLVERMRARISFDF
jgi:competence ComEA-like helix-hairpin-helix protein